MKKISIFDTTISDYNLGNHIIMDAIDKEIHDIFPHDFFFKLPSMEITNHTIGYLKKSDLVFFGGTNSLNGNMWSYRQWNISWKNCLQIKNVILFGTGWWKYQTEKPSFYTRWLLQKVLSSTTIHSVRDSYTEAKIKSMGINNVLNTGCPTLWPLTSEHCKKIPQTKAEAVVLTFTDYKQNLDRDTEIYQVLKKNYQTIYAWVQGAGDFDYIKKISPDIILIDPNLKAYDNFLTNNNVDYIGTRLHAGIRAMQYGRRSIIIGLDNRALEMKKDFNLPVIGKSEITTDLENMINDHWSTTINLPLANIATWKKQFKNEAST